MLQNDDDVEKINNLEISIELLKELCSEFKIITNPSDIIQKEVKNINDNFKI
jgi:hypothetical protein